MMTTTNQPRLIPVSMMRQDSVFRVDTMEYRLLYQNACRAYVQILNVGKRQITRKTETSEEILAEFDGPGRRVNIATMTMGEFLRYYDEQTVITDSDTGERKIITTVAPGSGTGGKPAADALKKPANAGNKLGKVLAQFMKNPSIEAAMSEFGMNRSLTLSFLYTIWKTFGIGYRLGGGNAVLLMPPGTADPFSAAPQEQKKSAVKPQQIAVKPQQIAVKPQQIAVKQKQTAKQGKLNAVHSKGKSNAKGHGRKGR